VYLLLEHVSLTAATRAASQGVSSDP